jgi:hypothetical protein
MGEPEDRVVGRLPVDALEPELAPLGQRVEDHRPRLVHRRQLRGVPEEHEHGEDLAQVLELPLVEHRALVHEADVERLLAPLPALDEVRPAEPRRRERAGDRPVRAEEGLRPSERDLRQPFDHRPVAAFGQPLGQLLVLRIIDRRVEDAVDRGRGHAAVPQHRGRLVRRRKDRDRPPVPPPAVVVVARDDLDARVAQGLGEFCKEHRLAGPGLAEDREHAARPLGLRHRRGFLHIHARAPQHFGRGVPGFGLIVGEPDRGHAHARDPTSGHVPPPDAISRPAARPIRRRAAPTSRRRPPTRPPSPEAPPAPPARRPRAPR